MYINLAIAAAIACALCNGVAAVVQKVSADKAKSIKGMDIAILARLFTQLPYATGLILDALAGFFTLVAVHSLPLFTVQTISASCVVITAYIERIFMHRKMPSHIAYAAFCVLLGLGLLSLASHAESAPHVSRGLDLGIELFPVVLLLVGGALLKWRAHAATAMLAIVAGVCFGGVSVVGRVISYPTPLWHVAYNPLLWSLTAYGVIGMFLFTAALQRTLATTVNALMVASQTIAPLLVGIFLLGDTAKNDLWIFVYAGCAAVIIGSIIISLAPPAKIRRIDYNQG